MEQSASRRLRISLHARTEMADNDKLWSCPDCGHSFVAENIWHSCGRYDFDHHFDGKDPIVLELFLRFKEIVERNGDVLCYSQKTRIVFQARIRFAHCQIRKRHLMCGLILPDENPDIENLYKIEAYGEKSFGHYFKFWGPSELSEAFSDLVRKAYLAARS